MRTRFVLVHEKEEHGIKLYCLAANNWGCQHYDTAEKAIEALTALAPDFASKLGWSLCHVIAAPCYDHGDCVGTVLDPDEYQPIFTSDLRKKA